MTIRTFGLSILLALSLVAPAAADKKKNKGGGGDEEAPPPPPAETKKDKKKDKQADAPQPDEPPKKEKKKDKEAKAEPPPAPSEQPKGDLKPGQGVGRRQCLASTGGVGNIEVTSSKTVGVATCNGEIKRVLIEKGVCKGKAARTKVEYSWQFADTTGKDAVSCP
jgi:hypothetical protein